MGSPYSFPSVCGRDKSRPYSFRFVCGRPKSRPYSFRLFAGEFYLKRSQCVRSRQVIRFQARMPAPAVAAL